MEKTINTILERELEELRIELPKLQAEQLPAEEVDEETLKAFEKDLNDMIEGRVETISGDEAVKMLSELLGEDQHFLSPCCLQDSFRKGGDTEGEIIKANWRGINGGD